MDSLPEHVKAKLERMEASRGSNNNSINNSTDSIGSTNSDRRRRVQSMAIMPSIQPEFFTMLKDHRPMSFSSKYYAGSHLLNDIPGADNANYCSLWLLPPPEHMKALSKEIAKLSLRYNQQQSSAPFTPHVTVIGSIPCGPTVSDAKRLGKILQAALSHSGAVPCRFSQHQPCQAMTKDGSVVWSQACISVMERSPEFLQLLERARGALKMPTLGEWVFPAPAGEPHYSKFYGRAAIPNNDVIAAPPDFVAQEASLWMTTPGTVEGVGNWKEVARIQLVGATAAAAAP